MLHSLHPPVGPSVKEIDFTEIIIIHGPGMPRSTDWSDTSGHWLENLVRHSKRSLQIYRYEYDVDQTSKDSVLQQLLAEGLRLLQCLDQRLRDVPKRHPVFFACHSLGGLILKRALCELRQHFYSFQAVADTLAGILFLGTPQVEHVQVPRPSSLIENILRSTTHKPLPPSAVLLGDDDLLTKLSTDFSHIATTIPILSAYESRPTKVYKTTFARIPRPKDIQITTKASCTIGAMQEVLVEIDCTHIGLCKVDVRSPSYSAIQELIEDILDSADAKIAKVAEANVAGKLQGRTIRSLSSVKDDIHARFAKAQPSHQQHTSTSTPDVSRLAIAGSSRPTHPGVSTEQSDDLPFSFEAAKRAPRLPCFTVKMRRERNSRFFGREAVFAEIDDALLPEPPQATSGASDADANQKDDAVQEDLGDRNVLRTFALCGIGGSGKTEVATEYAYRRQNHFDAVFWVAADNKTILREEFARIAVALELIDAKDATDVLSACDLVKGWLSNPVRSYEATALPQNEAKWLLIFDNADRQDVLEDFWPATGLGSVMVTSRDTYAKTQTYTAKRGVDLTPLGVGEASDMIKQLIPLDMVGGQERYIVELADKLGGLPLLLTQMSGVMTRLHLSCKDFLRLLEERDIEHLDWLGDERTRSAQVFKISTNIGLDGLSVESLGLLQMSSLLDPDCIPEDVLVQAFRQHQLSGFPTNVNAYHQARLELQQSSLISVNRTTGDLSLHRVVQDVTLANMEQTRHSDVYRATLRAVSTIWPFAELKDRFTTDRYPTCAQIFPSVVRLKQVQATIVAAGECDDPDAAAPLISDAGWYWFERGFPQEAKEFWRLVEQMYQRPNHHPTEVQQSMLRRANLDSATASMEANDAKDCLRRFKAWIDESASSTSDSQDSDSQYELALYHNELGVAYGMNDQYEIAIEHFLKSIDLFQRMPDYDDILLSWPEPNLGLVYWVQGRYEEAKQVLLEILQVHEDAWGPDDEKTFKTGKILYALGNVCTSEGEAEEGLVYHTRCLKQYRATLGDGHHRVGDVLYRISDHMIRLNRLPEAAEMIEQALKIFRARSYLRNELARAMYKKGQLYQAMNNDASAVKEFAAAFSLRRRLRPGDKRAMGDLTESDYDQLVIFWSR